MERLRRGFASLVRRQQCVATALSCPPSRARSAGSSAPLFSFGRLDSRSSGALLHGTPLTTVFLLPNSRISPSNQSNRISRSCQKTHDGQPSGEGWPSFTLLRGAGLRRGLLGPHAAVNSVLSTGDERTLIGGKKDDELRDIFRLGIATERDPLLKSSLGIRSIVRTEPRF